ncbi:MAG: GNAT family N-acetyltransferase [Candidatus Odinarchaeota archaeon]
MKDIALEKLSLPRDQAILKEMDAFVDWNMSTHPLSNLIDISEGGAFVARHKDRNIGQVFAFPYNEEIGWIAFLVVDPAYRKRGIGRALMDEAINFLSQKGMKSIGLYATIDGAPLYQKMGFVKNLTSWRFMSEGPKSLTRLKSHFTANFDFSKVNFVDFSNVNHELFEKVVSLDTTAFGANRYRIFENRLKMGSWHCITVVAGDRIDAFGMWRLIDNYFGFIGPIVCADFSLFQILFAKIALQLIEVAASKFYLGTDDAEVSTWMTDLGFSVSERPLLMFLGQVPGFTPQRRVICHPAKG